ncbi:MAG: hypothetical protein QOC80_467 [Frankiaceae bacterium]|nr:hypothetical protein [Frankiaceae bacterium]
MFRRRGKEQTTDDDSADVDGAEVSVTEKATGAPRGDTDAGPAEDGVTDADELGDDDELDDGSDDEAAEPGPKLRRGPAENVPLGPFDDADAPDDDVQRVDLGSLQVPIVDEVELRLEVNEQGELGQVLLLEGPNVMQIGAFAAPRSAGIWDEVRPEIIESVTGSGGSAVEVEGLYDIELAAQVPTGTPGQLAPARFLGIDRPRWFMRALISGPAALDPDAAELLISVLAGTVVVRGTDAMPIRDALPLRLPKEAVDAAEAQAAAAEAEGQEQGLDQLGPGPTITESR